jgi:LPXTG-site transpeptidase (sortase) family protein
MALTDTSVGGAGQTPAPPASPDRSEARKARIQRRLQRQLARITRPPRTLGPAARVVTSAITILSVSLLGFAVYAALVSRLHHDRAQFTAYADFRQELALATAPTGPTDPNDATRLLAPGSAVALLDIPQIGLKEVVFQGTSGDILEAGPGHLRDTPMPGQAGISEIMGRSTLYGGPFHALGQLAPGNRFTVTTGQGVHTYSVLDVRRAGDPQPTPLRAGGGRLILVTADGPPLFASGVLRVDADLVSTTMPTPPMVVGAAQISAAELPMGVDRSGWLWLDMWGQLLVLNAALAAMFRHLWGVRPTWVVFLPVLLFLGVTVADQAIRLLPNLM